MTRLVYGLQFITIALLALSVYLTRETAKALDAANQNYTELRERVRDLEATHNAEREERMRRLIEAAEREISRLEQQAPMVIR